MIRYHKRILYQFEADTLDRAHWVEFVKLAQQTPGWSHRVVIDGVAKDWLADTAKPGMKAARFFFEKHCLPAPAAGQEN